MSASSFFCSRKVEGFPYACNDIDPTDSAKISNTKSDEKLLLYESGIDQNKNEAVEKQQIGPDFMMTDYNRYFELV